MKHNCYHLHIVLFTAIKLFEFGKIPIIQCDLPNSISSQGEYLKAEKLTFIQGSYTADIVITEY